MQRGKLSKFLQILAHPLSTTQNSNLRKKHQDRNNNKKIKDNSRSNKQNNGSENESYKTSINVDQAKACECFYLHSADVSINY